MFLLLRTVKLLGLIFVISSVSTELQNDTEEKVRSKRHIFDDLQSVLDVIQFSSHAPCFPGKTEMANLDSLIRFRGCCNANNLTACDRADALLEPALARFAIKFSGTLYSKIIKYFLQKLTEARQKTNAGYAKHDHLSTLSPEEYKQIMECDPNFNMLSTSQLIRWIQSKTNVSPALYAKLSAISRKILLKIVAILQMKPTLSLELILSRIPEINEGNYPPYPIETPNFNTMTRVQLIQWLRSKVDFPPPFDARLLPELDRFQLLQLIRRLQKQPTKSPWDFEQTGLLNFYTMTRTQLIQWIQSHTRVTRGIYRKLTKLPRDKLVIVVKTLQNQPHLTLTSILNDPMFLPYKQHEEDFPGDEIFQPKPPHYSPETLNFPTMPRKHLIQWIQSITKLTPNIYLKLTQIPRDKLLEIVNTLQSHPELSLLTILRQLLLLEPTFETYPHPPQNRPPTGSQFDINFERLTEAQLIQWLQVNAYINSDIYWKLTKLPRDKLVIVVKTLQNQPHLTLTSILNDPMFLPYIQPKEDFPGYEIFQPKPPHYSPETLNFPTMPRKHLIQWIQSITKLTPNIYLKLTQIPRDKLLEIVKTLQSHPKLSLMTILRRLRLLQHTLETYPHPPQDRPSPDINFERLTEAQLIQWLQVNAYINFDIYWKLTKLPRDKLVTVVKTLQNQPHLTLTSILNDPMFLPYKQHEEDLPGYEIFQPKPPHYSPETLNFPTMPRKHLIQWIQSITKLTPNIYLKLTQVPRDKLLEIVNTLQSHPKLSLMTILRRLRLLQHTLETYPRPPQDRPSPDINFERLTEAQLIQWLQDNAYINSDIYWKLTKLPRDKLVTVVKTLQNQPHLKLTSILNDPMFLPYKQHEEDLPGYEIFQPKPPHYSPETLNFPTMPRNHLIQWIQSITKLTPNIYLKLTQVPRDKLLEIVNTLQSHPKLSLMTILRRLRLLEHTLETYPRPPQDRPFPDINFERLTEAQLIQWLQVNAYINSDIYWKLTKLPRDKIVTVVKTLQNQPHLTLASILNDPMFLPYKQHEEDLPGYEIFQPKPPHYSPETLNFPTMPRKHLIQWIQSITKLTPNIYLKLKQIPRDKLLSIVNTLQSHPKLSLMTILYSYSPETLNFPTMPRKHIIQWIQSITKLTPNIYLKLTQVPRDKLLEIVNTLQSHPKLSLMTILRRLRLLQHTLETYPRPPQDRPSPDINFERLTEAQLIQWLQVNAYINSDIYWKLTKLPRDKLVTVVKTLQNQPHLTLTSILNNPMFLPYQQPEEDFPGYKIFQPKPPHYSPETLNFPTMPRKHLIQWIQSITKLTPDIYLKLTQVPRDKLLEIVNTLQSHPKLSLMTILRRLRLLQHTLETYPRPPQDRPSPDINFERLTEAQLIQWLQDNAYINSDIYWKLTKLPRDKLVTVVKTLQNQPHLTLTSILNDPMFLPYKQHEEDLPGYEIFQPKPPHYSPETLNFPTMPRKHLIQWIQSITKLTPNIYLKLTQIPRDKLLEIVNTLQSHPKLSLLTILRQLLLLEPTFETYPHPPQNRPPTDSQFDINFERLTETQLIQWLQVNAYINSEIYWKLTKLPRDKLVIVVKTLQNQPHLTLTSILNDPMFLPYIQPKEDFPGYEIFQPKPPHYSPETLNFPTMPRKHLIQWIQSITKLTPNIYLKLTQIPRDKLLSIVNTLQSHPKLSLMTILRRLRLLQHTLETYPHPPQDRPSPDINFERLTEAQLIQWLQVNAYINSDIYWKLTKLPRDKLVTVVKTLQNQPHLTLASILNDPMFLPYKQHEEDLPGYEIFQPKPPHYSPETLNFPTMPRKHLIQWIQSITKLTPNIYLKLKQIPRDKLLSIVNTLQSHPKLSLMTILYSYSPETLNFPTMPRKHIIQWIQSITKLTPNIYLKLTQVPRDKLLEIVNTLQSHPKLSLMTILRRLRLLQHTLETYPRPPQDRPSPDINFERLTEAQLIQWLQVNAYINSDIYWKLTKLPRDKLVTVVKTLQNQPHLTLTSILNNPMFLPYQQPEEDFPGYKIFQPKPPHYSPETLNFPTMPRKHLIQWIQSITKLTPDIYLKLTQVPRDKLLEIVNTLQSHPKLSLMTILRRLRLLQHTLETYPRPPQDRPSPDINFERLTEAQLIQWLQDNAYINSDIYWKLTKLPRDKLVTVVKTLQNQPHLTLTSILNDPMFLPYKQHEEDLPGYEIFQPKPPHYSPETLNFPTMPRKHLIQWIQSITKLTPNIYLKLTQIPRDKLLEIVNTLQSHPKLSLLTILRQLLLLEPTFETYPHPPQNRPPTDSQFDINFERLTETQLIQWLQVNAYINSEIYWKLTKLPRDKLVIVVKTLQNQPHLTLTSILNDPMFLPYIQPKEDFPGYEIFQPKPPHYSPETLNFPTMPRKHLIQWIQSITKLTPNIYLKLTQIPRDKLLSIVNTLQSHPKLSLMTILRRLRLLQHTLETYPHPPQDRPSPDINFERLTEAQLIQWLQVNAYINSDIYWKLTKLPRDKLVTVVKTLQNQPHLTLTSILNDPMFLPYKQHEEDLPGYEIFQPKPPHYSPETLNFPTMPRKHLIQWIQSITKLTPNIYLKLKQIPRDKLLEIVNTLQSHPKLSLMTILYSYSPETLNFPTMPRKHIIQWIQSITKLTPNIYLKLTQIPRDKLLEIVNTLQSHPKLSLMTILRRLRLLQHTLETYPRPPQDRPSPDINFERLTEAQLIQWLQVNAYINSDIYWKLTKLPRDKLVIVIKTLQNQPHLTLPKILNDPTFLPYIQPKEDFPGYEIFQPKPPHYSPETLNFPTMPRKHLIQWIQSITKLTPDIYMTLTQIPRDKLLSIVNTLQSHPKLSLMTILRGYEMFHPKQSDYSPKTQTMGTKGKVFDWQESQFPETRPQVENERLARLIRLFKMPSDRIGVWYFNVIKRYLESGQALRHVPVTSFPEDDNSLLVKVLIAATSGDIEVRDAAAYFLKTLVFNFESLIPILPQPTTEIGYRHRQQLVDFLLSSRTYGYLSELFNRDLSDSHLTIRIILNKIYGDSNLLASLRTAAGYFLSRPPFFDYSALVPLVPMPTFENGIKLHSLITNFLKSREIYSLFSNFFPIDYHNNFNQLMSRLFNLISTSDQVPENLQVAAKYYLSHFKPINVTVQKVISMNLDLSSIFSDAFDFSQFTTEQYNAYELFFKYISTATEALNNFDKWSEKTTRGEFTKLLFECLLEKQLAPPQVAEAISLLQPIVRLKGSGSMPI